MKHTFTEQSKHIFCIHGNLEDMICTDNLRKEKFNEFLSNYLRRELGFETVVFYLAARGMRVYDGKSAGILAENIPVCEETGSAERKDYIAGDEGSGSSEYEGYIAGDGDDDFDESEFQWEKELNTEDTGKPEEKSVSDGKKEEKTVYNARIEVTDFIAMLDARIKDPSHKTAFVFESIADYMRVNSENDSQFGATLHYLLTDSLDDNQNRVIFLAMNKDLQQIYSEAANDDILRGVLFRENNGRLEYNQEAILSFGRPGRDEIANLLEHYRIYGYGKMGNSRFLNYPVSALDGLAYLIEQYMTVSGENSLSRLNEILLEWMRHQPEGKLLFDASAAHELFPKVLPEQLPDQILRDLEYAGEIYHRANVLKKYADIMGQADSPYDIARFTGVKRTDMDSAKRFLIRGIEKSNRSEAALALSDFLYYIGEVQRNTPVVVRAAALKQMTIENVSAAVKSWFAAAKNAVLVVDDMETLLSFPEYKQLLPVFHQIFLKELEHNRVQHFIFVVNSSKEEEVLGRYMAEYGIPKRNCLATGKQVQAPAENERMTRGDSER